MIYHNIIDIINFLCQAFRCSVIEALFVLAHPVAINLFNRQFQSCSIITRGITSVKLDISGVGIPMNNYYLILKN